MMKQKVWFITGASRGFGFEITKAALAAGDKVIATARSMKGMDSIEKLGASENVYTTLLDVTDEHQAKEAVAKAIEKFGRIDVLVNNAGYGLLCAVEEGTSQEVKRLYEVNVFGLLNVVREVLPYMRKQHSGHIINLSSGGGLSGYQGWGLYGSTKFAVEGITETMAMELAPLGIHATAIEPGFFRTNFLDKTSLAQSSNIIDDYSETVGKMRELAGELNRRQPGDPAKLAQAIISISKVNKPPVHLPLGSDTIDIFRNKVKDFEEEIQQWHDVIISTNHDDVTV